MKEGAYIHAILTIIGSNMALTWKTVFSHHTIFLITIIGKGALGVVQLMIAAVLFTGYYERLHQWALWWVRGELHENPADILAQKLFDFLSSSQFTQIDFYTIYFISHGLLHIGVVAAILSGIRGATSVGVAVLVGFVVFQTYEWLTVGGHMLLVLSAIDIFVIWITLREEREKRMRGVVAK